MPPNLSNPPRYRAARLLLLLALVPTHLKSGGENSDEFRRALEAFRLRQIASAASRDGVPVMMLGDMNTDSGDPPWSRTALPASPVVCRLAWWWGRPPGAAGRDRPR